ncbi:ABC transporter ATP-binding protein [Sanguibacter sp. 4.1]|uniref:ABC transporter ATP-binding protein n=1 Tax=Sanguibacter biliveldensis TaxID=3030830 RepID=A0AAF0Z8Q8_9MICO|nr:ABC transporter ATP-binding protein [Sanguibacter sp. 4.1]WPF82213.1 ABC transporter ATP-binding protein [Sanguibacter sp. 4.1]
MADRPAAPLPAASQPAATRPTETAPSGARASATTLPVAAPAQVRAVVLDAVRLRRGRAAAVAVLFLLASAAGLVVPACLGAIVDGVTDGAGVPVLLRWVAGAALGSLGAAGAALAGARVLTGLVQDVLASLREDVFASAMRLPVGVVDDGETSDLLSRVTGDVDAVAEAGGDVAPTLLSAGFAVVVSVGALTAIDPWLALAGLSCAPCYVVGARAFLRRSRIVFGEVRVREAARSQAVLEAVEGMETVTALGEQEQALARVRRRAEDSIRGQVEGVRLRNRLFRWINGGEALGLVAILATGFVLSSAGSVSVGMVTTAALVFHRLFGPVGQLIFGLDDIQRAAIGLARLVGVIEAAADVPAARQVSADAETSRQRPPGERRPTGVELRDVTFRYPTSGRGVSGVTLLVHPGTAVALVGTSGSGKSTIARVVAGHHEPSSGTVAFDHPTTPYYVSQELHAFRGSIGDSLRLAAPEAGDDEVVAALLAAGADWAVPTVVAESESERADENASADDAGGLSAPGAGAAPQGTAPLDEGRIQQLAIARAILADPEVVILDEATADVGLQHRAAVEAAVTALRRDRTVIFVAHRLQQVVTADLVVVVADGRVVQQGTHDELLRSEGAYSDFWQASAEPLVAETSAPR